jgi:hypothetical protein
VRVKSAEEPVNLEELGMKKIKEIMKENLNWSDNYLDRIVPVSIHTRFHHYVFIVCCKYRLSVILGRLTLALGRRNLMNYLNKLMLSFTMELLCTAC